MPEADAQSDGGRLVTVVIPTRGRPGLLRRALASVAAQTYPDLEIVIVVDGPDPSTEAMLAGWADRPLRVVVNERSLGGSGARNVGVRNARGRWVAFLDDDDEWLPPKLERQIADLRQSQAQRPIGVSQLITRSPIGDFTAPRRPPRRDEHLSEFLFVRSGWFKGGGRVQTSTLVVRRDLLLEIPFAEDVRHYQDTDWVLRAAAAGGELVMTMEPLSIWYVEEQRPTITSSFAGDWQSTLQWARERRHMMTPRAYGSLVLVRVGGLAASAGDPVGAVAAWTEAWRHGRPSARDVGVFLGKWVLPARVRRVLRSRIAAQRRPGAAPRR